MAKPQLDLAWPKPAAVAGTEERTSIACSRSIDVLPEQSAELLVKEHGFLPSAFCSDCDGPLSDVDVTGVQADERAEPDAGAEKERERRVVSFGNGAVRVGNCAEQSLRFVDRQVAWYSPVSRRRTDEPCRIVAEITSIIEEAEEDSQGCLGPVDSEDRTVLADCVAIARDVVFACVSDTLVICCPEVVIQKRHKPSLDSQM